MELFRLRSAGPEAGDCTAPYDVVFNRECTVREFIQEVLTKKEWGTIHIGDRFSGGPCISYKGDQITSSSNFPDDILNKVIKSGKSHGGWTAMDYWLDIWNEQEKLRFEYTKKLKEIESHLNRIKQLQNEMNELADKIEARPIVDPPPHLDRDGCVYWDSVLVKKENEDEL